MSRRLPGVLWAVSAVMAVASAALIAVGPGRETRDDIFGGVGGAAFLVLALAFATVGALVAARLPSNPIGWIFCLTGLANGLQLLTWNYADVALHRGALPGSTAVVTVNGVIGEATAGLLALALLLFPDGHLPSRRWRPALAILLGGMALLVFANTFRPGRLAEPFAGASNPLGIAGARDATTVLDLAGWLLVWTGLTLATAALVVRRRRARGVERRQLELVLTVAAAAAAVAAIDMATWLIVPEGRLQLRIAVLGLAFASLPVAAGAAILRYRLYDIDVIVRRTLVYAVLTAALAGVYFAVVLALQQVFSAFAGGSNLAVAGSTLAVAALFRPARSSIQRFVDRRFARSRYDAQRTVDAFSSRLRDQVDLDALASDLRQVVSETVQPAHVSLWLREPV
jgi:hypothetical protein